MHIFHLQVPDKLEMNMFILLCIGRSIQAFGEIGFSYPYNLRFSEASKPSILHGIEDSNNDTLITHFCPTTGLARL